MENYNNYNNNNQNQTTLNGDPYTNKQKYKLSKLKIAGIAFGLTLTLAAGGLAIQVKKMFDFPEYDTTQTKGNSYSGYQEYSEYNNEYNTQPSGQQPTEENNQANTQIISDYINTPEINELRIYTEDNGTIPIQISEYNYLDFYNNIQQENPFRYGDYYEIEEALNLYNNTITNKSNKSNLLDSNGKLDLNKLMSQVKVNNQDYLENEKNAVSCFYEELDTQAITEICQKIVSVTNSEYNDIEIEKVANTLTNLKILKKTGTSSNAYVSSDLAFIYNPTMTDMYADVNKIAGKYTNDQESKDSVIIHEIMHLLEYASSDNNKQNGIEAGICRMYNVPGQTTKLNVDSLWNTWILEAAAELGMSNYLDIGTGTYAKKISYAKSYNISRFNDLGTKDTALENIIFNPTLESAFEELKITDEKDKLNFLKYLYSVEITQYNTDDFWENYSRATQKTYTEQEKLQIKMQIRSDAIKYLSINFYSNLIDAIYEQKITDMDTAFYMIRNWELDAYSHLEYTKTMSLDPAKDFIEWQNTIHNYIFNTIAESNNLSSEEVSSMYDDYYLQSSTGNQIKNNCNLSAYSPYMANYIESAKNEYTIIKYSRIKDVYNYIQSTYQQSNNTIKTN